MANSFLTIELFVITNFDARLKKMEILYLKESGHQNLFMK